MGMQVYQTPFVALDEWSAKNRNVGLLFKRSRIRARVPKSAWGASYLIEA